MDKDPFIVGLDIGGTKVAVVVGSSDGVIHSRKQFATEPRRGFELVFNDIVETAQEAIEAFAPKVGMVSVSIGGPLNILQGIIKSPPNLPYWDDIPLKQLLHEKFGLPVYVEHDGNAGALAEYYFGAGKGYKNVIFLTVGTGLGAGLILDGRLYRGTSDVAGEVGHIRIAEDGPLCYGKRGSFEGYGSGTGIAKLAHIMFPDVWNENTTTSELYEAWKKDQAEARKVFERAALYFGRGLAMITDTLNPELIIMGGIGMRLRDAFVEPAIKVWREEALPEASEVCKIVPAELGERIGDLAALCAALDQGKLASFS